MVEKENKGLWNITDADLIAIEEEVMQEAMEKRKKNLEKDPNFYKKQEALAISIKDSLEEHIGKGRFK